MDHRNNVSPSPPVTEIEPPRRYVDYYRVSTRQQGRFGFSIESPASGVFIYVAASPGEIVAELSEEVAERAEG